MHCLIDMIFKYHLFLPPTMVCFYWNVITCKMPGSQFEIIALKSVKWHLNKFPKNLKKWTIWFPFHCFWTHFLGNITVVNFQTNLKSGFLSLFLFLKKKISWETLLLSTSSLSLFLCQTLLTAGRTSQLNFIQQIKAEIFAN